MRIVNDLMETNCLHAELDALVSVFIAQAMCYDTETLLRFVKQVDLTLPLLAVLDVVERQGATSIGEIGSRLDYSLANASLLVDKLVCQECVTRVENASDRRHKLVQLTAKGQALLAELRAARSAHVVQQLRLLPPERLMRTTELLRVITDELPLPANQRTTQQRRQR